jgi:hypothetical protein
MCDVFVQQMILFAAQWHPDTKMKRGIILWARKNWQVRR